MTVRIAAGVGAFDREEWNALGGNDNPFVSHEFLTAMEDSGSVGPGTGWEPAPIVITDDAGKLLAALPSYAKGHSQGEYVFDHAWADAWHRAGGRYYPKLQIAAPFTPATGPRLGEPATRVGSRRNAEPRRARWRPPARGPTGRVRRRQVRRPAAWPARRAACGLARTREGQRGRAS